MTKMIQEKAEVLWNREVSPGYFHMGLTCDPSYGQAVPGQFVMIRVDEGIYPLLRRPFSIHRQIDRGDGGTGIEILYRVVGTGTQRLSGLSLGARIELLGPLGNGFTISGGYSRIYIAAGGIGVAPMPFLVSRLLKSGYDPSCCTVFLGAKSRHDLLCREDFSVLGVSVVQTTDDGSAGDRCLVTSPLEAGLRHDRPDVIFACGPKEMIRCVADLALAGNVACQVSVESLMACGMGACLGCAVAGSGLQDRYLHACVDGPVFDVRDLHLKPDT